MGTEYTYALTKHTGPTSANAVNPNHLPQTFPSLPPLAPPPPPTSSANPRKYHVADAPLAPKIQNSPTPTSLPGPPARGDGRHDDRIQRRPLRPRPALVPAAPPALRGRLALLRLLRLLPRLLLLHLHARHLPGPPRPRRGAGGHPRREAPQAPVRPQPGLRPVPPGGPAVAGRRGRPRRRLPLPEHHAPLHRREPQQGGHPVRRDGLRRDVPRGAARGGGRARVRAARAQHPPAPDPRRRRPLQRPPVRRPGPRPRRRAQRPRRAPHHRRRRRQDPRPRILLPQSPGVGGLRDRHQPEEAVGDVQAMRRRRAKRVVGRSQANANLAAAAATPHKGSGSYYYCSTIV